MRKMKFIIIGIILLIIGAIVIYFMWPHMPWKKTQARKVAEEYLQEKYGKAWEYLNVRGPAYESVEYRVRFQGVENVWFEVAVPLDLNKSKCRDSYITRYFSIKCANEIENMVKEQVEEDISMQVFIDASKSWNLTEMDEIVNYRLYVNMERNRETDALESRSILEVIKIIKASKYSPEQIIFCYLGENDDDIFLNIEEWKNLTENAQIKELLDKAK